jgi:hypothetical protein
LRVIIVGVNCAFTNELHEGKVGVLSVCELLHAAVTLRFQCHLVDKGSAGCEDKARPAEQLDVQGVLLID